MGYLDLYSYEKLIEKSKVSPNRITIDSFADKTDRTLTLGKNKNSAIVHVFIKDGILHSHQYLELPGSLSGLDFLTVTWNSGVMDHRTLSPSFYAIPVATDEEFAELMLRLTHPLDFIDWNSEANQADESVAGYFGRIIRSA